jgi:integrase
MRQWDLANRQFERELQGAKAAQCLKDKADAGAFDALSAERLQYLADVFSRDWHLQDEEALRVRGGDWADRALAGWEGHLDDLRRWRAEGDTHSLEEWWGKRADQLLAAEGLRLDPADQDGRERLLWTLNSAALEMSEAAQARLKGRVVPIPPQPVRPARPALPQAPAAPTESFEAIVERLLESPRKRISATTKESVRTALRLFREVHGTPSPAEITRAMVADWLDMLAQRPAKLPPEHRGTPLPELVDLYRHRQDVPRLSAKTLAQHLSALGARWTQAGRSGRLDLETANPFKDHDLERAKRPKEAKGFSPEELSAIFRLPVFTEGERPRGGKGQASYWLPLLLLFTGARPEEIAQLLVDDVFQDAKSGRWMLRITDEGWHPHKGQQRLKTPESRRTFPVPKPLIDLGLLRYLEHLKGTEETALFPALRTKGARSLLFAGFGMWWSDYLRNNGVRLEGVGRQPSREARHTWSTAARASGLRREEMAYLQGHAVADATSGEGYGQLSPLGLAIDRVRFDDLDASAIQPWR